MGLRALRRADALGAGTQVVVLQDLPVLNLGILSESVGLRAHKFTISFPVFASCPPFAELCSAAWQGQVSPSPACLATHSPGAYTDTGPEHCV